MAARPRTLIIGGSVGGLMAASLLRDAGWTVTVFERTVGDLAGRGAGIGLSEELVQVMRRIGARLEPSMAVVHNAHAWMDENGGFVFEHRTPAVGSAWSRVYRRLRDLVPPEMYRQGMTFERVEENVSSVTAILDDGSRATGDLLVAADGVSSTVRRGSFCPRSSCATPATSPRSASPRSETCRARPETRSSAASFSASPKVNCCSPCRSPGRARTPVRISAVAMSSGIARSPSPP